MDFEPLLILGMHRSGTSCLAGCLEEAGLFLGAVNQYAPFNQKGNRENSEVMALHDAVLGDAGARWDAPVVAPWSGERLQRLRELLALYPRSAPWGVKDPRTLFALQGWRAVARPSFVGSWRHPSAVVGSLVRRSAAWKQPMAAEAALDLWKRYNERLLAEHALSPFPVIRFDQPRADYERDLRRMCAALGLKAPARFAFLDETLIHQAPEGGAGDAEAAALLARLEAASLGP